MEKNWRIPSHGSSDPMEKTGVSPPVGAQIMWKKLAYPLPWELRSYGKKLAYPLPWELRSCRENWRIPSHGSSDPMEKTGVSPPMGAHFGTGPRRASPHRSDTSGPGLGARARTFLRALISKSGRRPRLEMSAV